MPRNTKQDSKRDVRRTPYDTMYGKGPILIHREGDKQPLTEDQLMHRTKAFTGAAEDKPGAEQRAAQAQTMAKAGNPQAKEFLKESFIEEEDTFKRAMAEPPKRKRPSTGAKR